MAAIVCLPILTAGLPPVRAQEAPQPTAAELETLITTLEDDAQRAALVDQLRTLLEARQAIEAEKEAAPESAGAQLLSDLSERVSAVSTQLERAIEVVFDWRGLATWLERQASDDAARVAWLAALVKLAIVLVVGGIASWLLRRALARPRGALAARAPHKLLARLPIAIARGVLDLVPIIGFAIAANLLLPFTEPTNTTRIVALALVNAIVLVQALLVAARLVLAPDAASLRLTTLDDDSANYAYLWWRRLISVGVYGYFAAQAVRLLGAPAAVGAVLLKLLGLLLGAMAIVLILQVRASVARHLAGPPTASGTASSLRARLGDTWHILAIIYVIGLYVVFALGLEDGFARLSEATLLSVVIIIVARLAAVAGRRLVDRAFTLSLELRQRFPTLEARANRYLAIVHGAVGAVIWIVAIPALAQAWGLDIIGLLSTPAGQAVIGGAIRIVLIIAGAVVLLELVGTVVERYLARSAAAGGSTQLSARTRTVLPLIRNALRAAIGTIVLLVLLSELGIDIGPLLAGVGVLGLAIGFGAQKLVQDVITGLFILIEDTINVGDVANAGGHVGVVEAMTIRTIRMRDLSGTVHVVPFSEVTTIENLTKDFSFAVFDVGIAYREDTDEVVTVLQEVAEDLRQDPKYAPDILEPLEVLGVDAFGDSAVIVKVRLKTRPIKQWGIKREYNRRMKKAFDARGIEIPFPHQTLYFGVDKEGKAPPAYIKLEEPAETQPAPSPKPRQPTAARHGGKRASRS